MQGQAINPFSPVTREELLEVCARMETVRTQFYAGAVKTGCHPFIEFCGFMGDYGKLCEDAARQGIDFRDANTHTGQVLPMKDFQARYLAEKFDCIFGPSIRADARVAEVFRQAVFGKAAP